MGRAYKILLLVIILKITATCTADNATDNYCHMRTCVDPRPKLHTGCIFRLGQLGGTCTDIYQVISNGLEDLEQDEIVERHNEIRQYVAAGRESRGNPGPQPAATFMPDLDWDDELALLAQTWANQCIGRIDDCRNVDRYRVNQLVAHSVSDDTGNLSTTLDIINNWYRDVEQFDPYIVSNYTYDENTYHYTQMVWADTTKIGCGLIRVGKLQITNEKKIRYRMLPLEGHRYALIFVCNYGPTGNLYGHKVYETNMARG